MNNVRKMRSAALVAVSAVGMASVIAAAADAAAPAQPPTIASSFNPSLIGSGGTTAFGVTITNPNASASLSAIGFRDTFPDDLTIDDPNGESGTCGSAGVVTSTPGSQVFSLSGGSLKAGASCTVSVDVTATTPELLENNTGPVSSSAGSSAGGDTEELMVLAPPTITITSPANNATFTYGQIVRARYTCGQSAYVFGLEDCSAVDDLGNPLANGQAIETTAPGAHQLTVLATSIDGLVSTDTANYTVLPNNTFKISKLKAGRGGALRFQLALPGAGKVEVLEQTGRRTTVGAEGFRVRSKESLTVTVRLNGAGRGLLAKAPFTIRLSVAYTPNGGRVHTVTVRGIRLT